MGEHFDGKKLFVIYICMYYIRQINTNWSNYDIYTVINITVLLVFIYIYISNRYTHYKRDTKGK